MCFLICLLTFLLTGASQAFLIVSLRPGRLVWACQGKLGLLESTGLREVETLEWKLYKGFFSVSLWVRGSSLLWPRLSGPPCT